MKLKNKIRTALGLLILGAGFACLGGQQTINIGTTNNDGTGDPLRVAFEKANSNFTDLYTGTNGSVHTNDARALTLTNPATLLSGSFTNGAGAGTVLTNGVPVVYSNGVAVAGISTNGHLSVQLSGTNLVSIHAIGNTNSGIMLDAANTNDTLVVVQSTNVGRFNKDGFTPLRMHLADVTNFITMNGTVSSTNGNFWLRINDSGDYSYIGIGDQIVLPGSQQYLVTGKTNSGTTNIVAIYNAGGGAATQTGTTGGKIYPASVTLSDSQPIRTGGLSGNSVLTLGGFSIGNNGGVFSGITFADGYDTANICNQAGTPNFLGISVGVGRGGGFANQMTLQVGSIHNSLDILASSLVSPTYGLTNESGGSVYIFGGAALNNGNLTLGQPSTLSPSQTFTTVNGNATITGTAGAFAGLGVGDMIYATAYNTPLFITHVTSSTSVQVDQTWQNSGASGIAFTVHAHEMWATNGNNHIASSIGADGSFIVDGADSSGNAAAGFLTVLGTNSMRDYMLNDSGGPRRVWRNQAGKPSFSVSANSDYDALMVLPSGWASFRFGITNTDGATIPVGSTLMINTNLVVSGGISSTVNITNAMTTTGYTNAGAGLAWISGFTGTSCYQSNVTTGVNWSLGTITTPTPVILQSNECVVGTSCAAPKIKLL